MEVKVLELLNGVQIIGQVNVMDNVVVVKKPRVLVLGQGGQIGLGPFPMFADATEIEKNGVILNRDLVLYDPVLPHKQLIEAYQQQTSSIITPSRPTLIVE